MRCRGESEASERERIGRKRELAGHDLDRPAVEWMQATDRYDSPTYIRKFLLTFSPWVRPCSA